MPVKNKGKIKTFLKHTQAEGAHLQHTRSMRNIEGCTSGERVTILENWICTKECRTLDMVTMWANIKEYFLFFKSL